MERHLAAILAADVVGYSRAMIADETGTLERLKALRRELLEPLATRHGGRTIKLMGDGTLMEFASVFDAVVFAVCVQMAMRERNAKLPENERLLFRIGINLGDVINEGDDIYGNGVNIAARLEGLAEPGGICIRRNVRNQVRDRLKLDFEDLGELEVKNIDRPVRAFKVLLNETAERLAEVAESEGGRIRKRKVSRPLVAALILILVSLGLVVAWVTVGPQTSPQDQVAYRGVLSEKSSIAVLPFENISGDPDQDYFAGGMTEDLTTDLAKISRLMVIARNSTSTYQDLSMDMRQIAIELGVHYLVRGSVRKSGDRVRINAQLIDGRSGEHLWAERYDRNSTDIFDLQDEITSQIIAKLKIEVSPGEQQRLASHLTDSPKAYDLYIQALQHESYYTKEGNQRSIALLQSALEIDPNFAAAIGRLATAHTLAAENAWTKTPEESLAEAQRLAEKAVGLNDELPAAHWVMARVFSRPGLFDGAKGIASLERAIELDPNYADAYAMLANIQNRVGKADEALGNIEHAMRLNPHFPFWYRFVLGSSQFMLTRYEAAARNFEKAIELNPNVPWPHRWLASAYGHLGRIDDAQWELVELESLGFETTISDPHDSNIDDPDYLERYLDGLRKAGTPEQ
ncbi:adenylate/guanylate cyclase domain-containing protein [Limibacillus halophilus]